MENSPIVSKDRLYLFMGRHQFHFVDHETGRKTTPFTSGYFGNAFVEGSLEQFLRGWFPEQKHAKTESK